MADDKPKDLGESFREVVTQWEREFNAFANRIMGTETYGRVMNQAQNSQLGFQQMFSDVMGRHFSAMNLATRDDLQRVSAAIQDVAQRLERIEARLEPRMAEVVGADVAKGPPRTKRPPDDYLPNAGEK